MFTGDCDGKDIIKGLEIVAKDVKDFFYVDAPHHGSNTNHMKEFLHYFDKIDHFVFSYCSEATVSKSIEEAKNAFENEKITSVHFNSCEYRDKLHMEYVKESGELKKFEKLYPEHFEGLKSNKEKLKKYVEIDGLEELRSKHDWKENKDLKQKFDELKEFCCKNKP